MARIIFTNEIKEAIIDFYKNGLSLKDIGLHMGISKTPIRALLSDLGLLRQGKSTGVKLILTDKQKDLIKKLYLDDYKSCVEISKILSLNPSYIDKFLSRCDFRRNKGKAASIGLVKRYRNMNYDDYLKNIDEYYKYELEVLKITRQQPIQKLENFENRGNSGVEGAFHLDHKFSVVEGFKNGVKPAIIGNIKNLQFIPWRDNLKKRTKCSITIEELINN